MIVLSTLGSAAIDIDGRRIVPSAERMFAAVLYLSAERGRDISRTGLQEMLFPVDTVKNGSHSLRQLLYQLRKYGIDGGNDPAHLRIRSDAVYDPVSELASGGPVGDDQLRAIAVGYLPGYFPSFSREYVEWLDRHRGAVGTALLRTLAPQLSAARTAGEWTRAERVARACLSLDSLHEEATLVLAEGMALTGSKSEAMHMLDRLSADVGGSAGALKLPATVLRRRISERLPDAYAKKESPLVGREEELKRIAAFLDPAEVDPTTLLLLVGDAGIGKTRLVERIERLCAIGGVAFARVAIQPYYSRRPLSFFSDVIPHLTRMPGALGCSPESLQFLRVLQHGSAEHLDPALQEPDAEAQFARILRAIDDILDAITAETRVVLVAEDAHDLDPLSARLLSLMASKRGARRLRLIATLRRGSVAERTLTENESCAALNVEPLSTSAAAALVDHMCLASGAQADPRLQEWWVSVAGGSPLFLTMLVAHHATTGERYSIPANLHDLVTRRLNTLSGDGRQLFEACAVLSANATLPNVEYCTGLTTKALHDALRQLELMGLVRVADGIVTPVHGLLADAAVAVAPTTVRLLLHRRAAEAVERSVAAGQRSWSAASLWSEAEDGARRIHTLVGCADQLIAIGRPGEACDILGLATDQASSPAERRHLIIRAAAAAESAGRYGTVWQLRQSLGSLRAPAPGDEAAAIDFLSTAEAGNVSGQAIHLHSDTTREIANDAALGSQTRLRACRLLLSIADLMCDSRLGFEAFSVSQTFIPTNQDESDDQATVAMTFLTSFGDMAHASPSANQLIESLYLSQPGRRSVRTAQNLSLHFHRSGESARAMTLLAELTSECLGHGLVASAFTLLSLQAFVCLDLGHFAEAMELQERADTLATQSVDRSFVGGWQSNRIRLALNAGDPGTAGRVLEAMCRAPTATVGRYGWLVRSYRLRLQRIANGSADLGEVDALVGNHLDGRGYGYHDDIAQEVFYGLARTARHREGRQLLEEYLRDHRRDRFQVPAGLLACLS